MGEAPEGQACPSGASLHLSPPTLPVAAARPGAAAARTARGPAQRAVKAVRVALSDAPEAERTSAIARADETLRALALYYLPTVDRQTPSLIGARRAIEPAP